MKDQNKTKKQLIDELAQLHKRITELEKSEAEHLSDAMPAGGQVKKVLSELEEHYRSLVKMTRDVLYTLSSDGTITFLSSAFEAITGWSHTDWIGKPFTGLIHPDDLPLVIKEFQRDLNGKIIPVTEWRILCKSGEYKTGEFKAAPQVRNGRVVSVVGIARDITERKRAEEKLNDANSRFQMLQQLTASVHSTLGLEEVFRQITDSFVCSMGYNSAVIIKRNDKKNRFEVKPLSSKKWILTEVDKILGFALKNHSFPVDPGLNAAVNAAMRGEIVVAKTAEEVLYPLISKTACSMLQKLGGIKNYILVPLQVDKEVVGGVIITTTREEVSEEEFKMVKIFGQTACHAIQNANLHTLTQQAKEALRESQENFKALAENANDGILIATGEEGWHVYANKRAVEITGYPIQELFKKCIRDLAHPDELPKLTERYKKRLKGLKVPKPYETALVNKDGIKVPIEISPSKTTWQNQPAEMVIFRDITERKQAENELRKFKTISDKAGYGVSIVDLEGNVIYNNTAYGRMHGYTPGELIGKHLSIFHTEQQMANVNRLIEQLNREGSYVAEEVWHKRNDNTEFPILMNGTLVKDENGTPLLMAATAIDITERKRAEEALQASETKYRIVANNTYDWEYWTSPEGRFLYTSPSCKRITGHGPDEFIADPDLLYRIVHPDDRLDFDRHKDEMTQKIAPYEGEFRVIRPDGTVRWIGHVCQPVFAPDGHFLGTRGSNRDITERKRMDEVLKKSAQLLKDTGEMAEVGGWELDLSTKEVLWTEEVGRIHGVEPGYKPKLEEAMNFYAPESRPALEVVLKKAAETGEPYDLESLFIPSGSKDKIWVRSLGRAVYSGDKIVKLAGTFQNINKYKRAEEALRETEELYRTVLQTSPDGISINDMEGRITFVSERMLNLFGLIQPEDVIGHSPFEFIAPEDHTRARLNIQDVSKTNYTSYNQYTLVKKDGTKFTGEINSSLLRDASGKPIGMISVIRDITERKQMEEALRESEEKYRALIEAAGRGGEGIIIIQDSEEHEGAFVFVNDRFCTISGYSREELLGRSAWDFVPHEISVWLRDWYKRRHMGESLPTCYEAAGVRKDGAIVPLELSIVTMPWQGKTATALYLRDITERKQAGETLQKNVTLYRGLIETTDTGFVILGQDGEVLDANQEYVRLSGHEDLSQIRGRNVVEWTADYEKERNAEAVGKCFREGQIRNLEIAYSNAQGKITPIEINATAVKVDGAPQILTLCRDITERKRVEEDLRRKSGEQALLLNNIQTQVWYLTDEETYGAVNKARAEFFGKKNGEMENKKLYDVLSKDEADICISGYVEVFEKRKQIHTEEWITNAKGEKRLLSIIKSPKLDENGDVEYVVCSAEDITERKRAEDEIKKLNEELERRVIERTTQLEATNKELQFLLNIHNQTEEELVKYKEHLEELVKERTQKIRELEGQRTEIEKLAAAGRMAARIAHEINNPLAGIKNSFLLVKDAVLEDHPYYEYVGRIDNEINRIARIVRQMFDVYRPEQEIKKEFLVDKTLYEVVALLEAAWRENNITIEIDSKPITMEMPEGLLRQVLYNILLNAIEASPPGGVVKIMTEVNNEILTLSISDQGVGVPLEVHSRIFEPFFTSKHGSQKGLGLGLSVSKDIVEKLGGHIDFESEPGKGTLFRIILPLKSGARR